MNLFAPILRALQAAIAARAARDQSLTVLLVALWGRIARMGTRLERLLAQWRAGKLPKPRLSRAGLVAAPRATPRVRFPTAPAWLVRKMGFEVVAFGSQLAHALTDAEYAAFLADCPQAGRVLRPLLGMLGVAHMPAVVRVVKQVVVAVEAVVPVGITEAEAAGNFSWG